MSLDEKEEGIKKINRHFLQRKGAFQNEDDYIIKFRKYEKKRDITRAYQKKHLTILDLEDINKLKVEEIAPQSFERIISKNEEMNNRLENASYTKAYRCFKCGNNQTTVVYIQTRSSDEPMTAFIKCVICNNQFRN